MLKKRCVKKISTDISVREYIPEDIEKMAEIWNEVVRSGVAFPQENELSAAEAAEFFGAQTLCGTAVLDGEIAGMYILHPNNVGRCGHICNASYAVMSKYRGRGVGEALVRDCLKRAKDAGFEILQFNAVVATNLAALKLYKKLGFKQLGKIEGGFRLPDGTRADIIPHVIAL